MNYIKNVNLSFFLIFTICAGLQSQEISNEKLKVFIEGKIINFDYIRQNTTFVDFVNDPKVSDIHIIIFRQSTGSGGFTFDFLGSESLRIPSFKLFCYSLPYDMDEVIRKKFIKTLHSGLLPYVNQKNGLEDLKVIATAHKMNDDEKECNSELLDPWQQWVFSLSTDFGFEGEESKRKFEYGIFGRFAKINEKWKIINKYSYEKSKEIIKKDNGEVIESLRIDQEIDIKLIYSLNSHWSTGLFLEANQSTFSNLKMSLKALPAIQYNFYDWSKSSKKQLTFSYFVGPGYNEYYEPTIFDKRSEWIWRQNFGIALNKTETWGKIFAWLKGGHIFYYFSKPIVFCFQLFLNKNINK